MKSEYQSNMNIIQTIRSYKDWSCATQDSILSETLNLDKKTDRLKSSYFWKRHVHVLHFPQHPIWGMLSDFSLFFSVTFDSKTNKVGLLILLCTKVYWRAVHIPFGLLHWNGRFEKLQGSWTSLFSIPRGHLAVVPRPLGLGLKLYDWSLSLWLSTLLGNQSLENRPRY